MRLKKKKMKIVTKKKEKREYFRLKKRIIAKEMAMATEVSLIRAILQFTIGILASMAA